MGEGDVAARFRRRGRVWAHRLEAPRTWSPDGVSHFRAKPGDWWVENVGGGNGRCVEDGEFHRTHELIEAPLFRRTGAVTARRVSEAILIRTLEGTVRAEAGMWVLTSDSGASWPVTDEYFRQAYEPAEPEGPSA